jgi:two-component system chemotaxis response regulator CheY
MAASETNPYEDIRVLVIDDEAHTRTLIKAMLHQIGVVWVRDAQDGLAGLALLEDARPDLVLCDIHMEPVDGFEFLKRLRALGDTDLARTPVVFLTADRLRDSVLEAMSLHVTGYLLKPVSLWDLKVHLRAALDQR